MKVGCLVVVLSFRGMAVADPDDLSTVRSQIGWGTSVNPDRVGVATEGGWSGADHQAEVAATAEATVIPRTSVFVTMQYGGASATTRPAIGAAYQLVDPRHGPNGARITVAYKPEGLTEPGGEIESGLVLSRQIGADSARLRGAYGQDPEGRESDAELGASYIHDLGAGVEIGATSRFRHALKVKTALEPRWDVFGGAVGAWVVHRSRVEVLLGVNTVGVTPAPPVTGVLALVSLATEL
jgi:hypothetical protein